MPTLALLTAISVLTIMEYRISLPEEKRKIIFGEARQGRKNGIVLENAKLKNYETVVKGINEFRSVDGLDVCLSPQKILEEFTSIRGQTALENGVADENSLRYTRVINHYWPGEDKKEMVFEADISYDKSYEKDLRKIISALRLIGLDRNRGLGNVRCELIPSQKKPVSSNWNNDCIYFEMVNDEPLMISSASNQESLTYIPGKNLLGALAAAYLEDSDNNAESEEFKKLFLGGDVKYSNIYISDHGQRCIPAPAFINRMKKSGKYINVLQNEPDVSNDPEYSSREGNQPKKLHGMYLLLSDQKEIALSDVKTEVAYHHRKNTEKADDQLLYTQNIISEKQTFSGNICGSEKSLKIINELLEQGTFYFGKSRSAQYGKCRVTKIENGQMQKALTLTKGDLLLVTAVSDLVLLNERDYTVNFDDVFNETARQLKIDKCVEKPDESVCSLLDTVNIWGYQNKWNLRKAPVPAIAAGSTLVYRITGDCSVSSGFIGEFTHEGYGEIRLFRMKDYPFRLKTNSDSDTKSPERSSADLSVLSKDTKQLIEDCLFKSLREKIRMSIQLERENGIRLNASKLGRITLMLKESLAKNDEIDKQYCDLRERINSIKTKRDREEVMAVLEKYIGTDKCVDVGKMLQIHDTDLKESPEYKVLKYLESPEKAEERVKKIWGDILMEYLTVQKYAKKA